MTDNVNHPPHYTNSDAKCDCGRTIECIDIVRHMDFNLGNCIKYIWRNRMKGNALEDLKKARWYLDDEIRQRESTITQNVVNDINSIRCVACNKTYSSAQYYHHKCDHNFTEATCGGCDQTMDLSIIPIHKCEK